jgi:hypothetical protein
MTDPISYRKVLQDFVPQDQRLSTSALVRAHGLGFPASLLALIQVLEHPVQQPGPQQQQQPPQPPPPIIQVSLGFAPGDLANRVLHVTGQNFAADQAVLIQITATVDGTDPSTDPEVTPVSGGAINFTKGVFCAAGVMTTYSVQATGLQTGRTSQPAGVTC